MYVELFGIPRQRAGVSTVHVDVDTLGQLLDALVAKFPALRELIEADGLHPSVVANLNGDEFVSDPDTALAADDHLLILSADVGG